MPGDWSRDFPGGNRFRQVEGWIYPTEGLCKQNKKNREKSKTGKLQIKREKKWREKGDDGGGELWRNEIFPCDVICQGPTVRPSWFDLSGRHGTPLIHRGNEHVVYSSWWFFLACSICVPSLGPFTPETRDQRPATRHHTPCTKAETRDCQLAEAILYFLGIFLANTTLSR